jgi:hypothetical protein
VLVTQSTMPKGAEIVLVNDGEQYLNTVGGMRVHITSLSRMVAYMDLAVSSTAASPALLDLGAGVFKTDMLGIVSKMEKRSMNFNIEVVNHANLPMQLFALVAPDSLVKTLTDTSDTNKSYLTPGKVADYLSVAGRAEKFGYVNLLGPNGITIPPRNSTAVNTVALSDTQINTIVMSDSCAWRWQVRFTTTPRDAMADTDYINVNSWLHLEGTNRADSLFSK